MARIRPVLAKISRPTLAGVHPRARLFRALDRARSARTLWISGPPGSGKTALAAGYLERSRKPVLWYRLDAGDSDPGSLFHYLRLAADQASRARKPLLPAYAPEAQADLAVFARRYFERLYARWPTPFLLVFDNYHELPEQSPAHDVLRCAVETLPPGARALMLSRGEPPAAFARLVAHGDVAVPPDMDLRFTPSEARAVARRHARTAVSTAQVDAVHARTAGWVAGFLLLLEHGPAPAPVAGRNGDSGRRVLFDYFAGEILDKLAPELQAVLLRAAFLPALTATAVASLTGERHAGRLLHELHRGHCFLERHDSAEPEFSLHPLFRDFLQTRARQHLGPEEHRALQAQVAQVLEAGGMHEQAVHRYQAAEDWAAAGRVLATLAPTLLAQGRAQSLAQWLAAQPPSSVAQQPWLGYWSGVCAAPSDPEAGRAHFEQAYAGFHARNDDAGLRAAWSGVIEGVLRGGRSFALLDAWIDRVPHAGSGYAAQWADHDRVIVNMLDALVLRQPFHPRIDWWAEQALAVFRGTAQPRLRVRAAATLAHFYMWRGEAVPATRIVQALRALGQQPGLSNSNRLNIAAVEALHAWLVEADLDHCRAIVETALALGRSAGVRHWDAPLLGHLLGASLSAADAAGAQQVVERLLQLGELTRPLDATWFRFYSAWHALAQGDPAGARGHFLHTRALHGEFSVPFGDALLEVVAALVQLHTGAIDAAVAHLARAEDLAQRCGTALVEVMVRLAQAELAEWRGDHEDLLQRLRQGLAVGRRQGLKNVAYWRGPVMARLLARAAAAGIEPDYVRSLIRRRGLMPPALDADELEHWPWPLRIYTLGRFSIMADDAPEAAGANKGQRKPVELLRAIIASGGRDVPQERVAEALWPDADGDAAQVAFDTNLHRLRRVLGADVLVVRDGRVSLDARRCWVDVWALERLLSALELEWAAGPVRGSAARTVAAAARLLALYRGAFLADAGDTAWVVPLRERLRSRFQRVLAALGQGLEAEGHWERAIECYQRGLEADLLSERFYAGLMRSYDALGRRAEALAVYRRCAETLHRLLGVAPSAATESLHRRLENTTESL